MTAILLLTVLMNPDTTQFQAIPLLSLSYKAGPLPSRFFLPPERDPMWGKDKVYHFSLSFIICTSAMVMGKMDERQAFAVTVGIGLLKEFYDWGVKRTGFSPRDLLYDIAGAASAASFGRP